jgi:membrane protease YdiL (CAAX protease family)
MAVIEGTVEYRPAGSGPRALVARYPLISFFTLAFALSWLAWTPYVLSDSGLGLEPIHFPVILGSTQLAGVLPGAYLGPICAAFIVTALGQGRPGLRRWLGRFVKWRVNWRWYAGVILGVPAALTATGFLFSDEWQLPSASLVPMLVAGLVIQILTTGLAEEPGWRDFALPHIQARFGPLLGTLILGVLWGAWHLPLFLTDWAGPSVEWTTVAEFVASAVAVSFIMTWVFNRTGESLPVAMILHSGINNYMSIAYVAVFPTAAAASHESGSHVVLIAAWAVAAVLIVATRGRLGYRADHRTPA